MKTIFLTLFIFMLSCSGVLGMQGENEKFIQGKWRLTGNLGDQNKNQTWLLEWEFKNGSVTQSGYPPLLQKGKYRVLESKENTIKLKLYDQKGTFGTDDNDLEIIIDKKENTLTIGGEKGFQRQKSKK
jgi:hypothetical protein